MCKYANKNIGAAYLFISKNIVTKPCPKKFPVRKGGVPNAHECYSTNHPYKKLN